MNDETIRLRQLAEKIINYVGARPNTLWNPYGRKIDFIVRNVDKYNDAAIKFESINGDEKAILLGEFMKDNNLTLEDLE